MKTTILSTLFLTAAFVSGCGSQLDIDDADAANGRPQWIGNVSFQPEFGKSDWQLFNHIVAHRADSILDVKIAIDKHEIEESNASIAWIEPAMLDSAWAKRKAALVMGRCELLYDFNNYYYFDGVSGLIYNVSYFFSVPHKALRCLRCSDGLVGWIMDVLKLLFGAILAVIGMVLATVFNTVCHPIETLANICGIAYFNTGWWTYFAHTNIFASLWDLIWGGVIYPLWQALTFWL